MLRRIVRAFVPGHAGAAEDTAVATAVSPVVSRQIREYVEDYGETLIDLPEETWETSVSLWMVTHWEVLVDLWTAEAGRSDLVLAARIFETDDGYRIEVDSVHVP